MPGVAVYKAMAIGFPARFREGRTYRLAQDELAAVVKSAFESLGWSYKALSGEEFLASVPFGGGTWGEEFRVRLLPSGVVEAESKCVTVRMPQVFDFGKNRQNVEKFFSLVEHGIGSGVEQVPVSAAAQGLAWQQTAVKRQRGVAFFGGCLALIFIFIALMYFICAVVGLLTGNLFLPGRGSGSATIHGPWARIISVIILALFAWSGLWWLRDRKRSRRGRA